MNNQLKTVILLGALSALLMGLGSVLAPGHLVVFAALAVLMNVGSYFFSDRIVLAVHRAREVSPDEAPRLHRAVDELSRAAGIPKPRVCVIPDARPNAFATGRNPAHAVVAVTEGIMHVLDDRELRGVLAHELAHVKNRDILVATIAATVAAVVSSLAHAASFIAMMGGRSDDDDGPSAAQGLVLALVAPIAATVIQLAISRSREYLADETGARIAGDAEGLASALEKLETAAHVMPPAATSPATASLFIVSPLAGVEGVMSLFSTHPRTAERIRRLRELGRNGGASRVVRLA